MLTAEVNRALAGESVPRGNNTSHLPFRSLVLLGITGVLLVWVLGMYAQTRHRQVPDFAAFYQGGVLVGTPRLYDVRANLDLQEKLFGERTYSVVFLRTPAYAAMVRPLQLLSPSAALMVWRSLLIVALTAFVFWWPGSRIESFVAVAWSAPAMLCCAVGQDTPLLMPFIAAAVISHRSGRRFAAGLCIAVCLIKFHLILTVAVLILARRQWRFALGLTAGALFTVAASTAIQGWQWPIEYLRLILDPVTGPHPERMANLAALVSPFSTSKPFIFAVGAMVVVALWYACRKLDFAGSLSLCLLAALIIGPHVYRHDYILALPAALLFWRRVPFSAGLLAPISYLFPAAAVVFGLGTFATLTRHFMKAVGASAPAPKEAVDALF